MRQLNFYNFRKVNRERTFWIYKHWQFHRDRPEDLHLLRRRTCLGVDGRKQRSDVGSLEKPLDYHQELGQTGKNISHQSKCHKDTLDTYPNYLESKNKRVSAADPKALIHSVEDDVSCGAGRLICAEKNVEEPASFERSSNKARLQCLTSCPYSRKGNFPIDSLKQLSYFCEESGIALSGSLKRNNSTCDDTSSIDRLKKNEKPLKKRAYVPSNGDILSKDSLSTPRNDQYNSEDSLFEFNEAKNNNDILGIQKSDAPETPVTKKFTGAEKNNDSLLLSSTVSQPIKSISHCYGLNIHNKITRDERNRHSLLVAQVAQKLQLYARRGVETNGTRRGKNHKGIRNRKGRTNSGYVTPPNEYGDTMRYHALTYDDEIGKKEFDVSSGNILLSDAKCETGFVITDESDNSEDGVAPNIGKVKIKESSINGANATHKSVVTVFPIFPCHVHPAIIASINKKMLLGIGGFSDPRHESDDGRFRFLTASLSGFCMSTHPLDVELAYKVEHLLASCRPLSDEFSRYRTALLPGVSDLLPQATSVNHVQNNALDLRLGKIQGYAAIRDFKVFAVNLMENVLKQNYHCLKQPWLASSFYLLSDDEASVLQSCTSVWCENIAVQS